jgi:hypothetical protein
MGVKIRQLGQSPLIIGRNAGVVRWRREPEAVQPALTFAQSLKPSHEG